MGTRRGARVVVCPLSPACLPACLPASPQIATKPLQPPRSAALGRASHQPAASSPSHRLHTAHARACRRALIAPIPSGAMVNEGHHEVTFALRHLHNRSETVTASHHTVARQTPCPRRPSFDVSVLLLFDYRRLLTSVLPKAQTRPKPSAPPSDWWEPADGNARIPSSAHTASVT